MKRVVVLLVTAVLIAGMAGCPSDAEPTPPVEYELTISSTEGGETTTPGEGIFTYEAGTVVSLVAEAEYGHRFVNWTGGGGIGNRYSPATAITMDGDYSITANFVAVYELTMSSTEGGSVTTPGEGRFTYDEGAVVGLVATPEIGDRFVIWAGDLGGIADVEAASTTVEINGTYAIRATFEAEEAVLFADPNLEAAVREAINVPERSIYPSDLKGLTWLDATEKRIADLCGIEYATNLVSLNLGGNQIQYISPLAGLSSLKHLYLWGNQIGDVSLLRHLANLTELDLQHNQIRDISPLAELTKLARLTLRYNEIRDLSPLAGLTSLTGLFICRNEIPDLSLLTSFVDLRELDVTVSSTSDALFLVSLTNLTWLGLSILHITDAELSHLADITMLRSLDLEGNQLSDISPLEELTELEFLHLGSSSIRDILPLAELTKLTGLALGGNQIQDISPLAGLSSLKHLYLWGNQISDVSPLSHLANLTKVDLQHNQISDISPLTNLTGLTRLGLGGNQISDISSLAGLTSLTWLNLSGNQVSDVSPLVENEGLSEADEVDLRDNPLSSDSINIYIPQLLARGVAVDY